MKIPFNKPCIGNKEILSISRVIRSGKIGGDGPVSRKVEKLIERLFHIKYVFLTTSCTHALEMALLILGIKENDEVILPSFGFVSAANAIARLKARPVFVDIEENYLNINPVKIKDAITKKTKAIICVHYAGVSCDMAEIIKIAKAYGLFIVEDAAQAVGSRYNGRYLGTIGDIGCYSFHETKNITCGEGGAFLTNSEKIARKVEIIREKGTNRSSFLLGKIAKYTWVDVGSSYIPSEILSAMLLEQFKRLKTIIAKRRAIGLRYIAGLKDMEEKGMIILPQHNRGSDFNWHIFYIRVHSKQKRDYVLKNLKEKGIEASFHFVPLHLSPYAKKEYTYKKGDLPITEKVSQTLIRLPVYPGLNNIEQEYIIDSLHAILN